MPSCALKSKVDLRELVAILGRSEQQHKTGPEGKSGDLSEQAGGSCHVETLSCLRGSGNPQHKS